MATDIIFHRFWLDLESILGCFLVLKSEMDTKKTAKKYLRKSHATDPEQTRDFPLWSLKRTEFQDWQTNPGIMTLHWCLAARWRIFTIPTILQLQNCEILEKTGADKSRRFV